MRVGNGLPHISLQKYGKQNIAVIDKGHVGGGNIGRNTTIVRSNYMLDGNVQFYEHSVKLWENVK